LERLEVVLPKPVTTADRSAFIVIGDFDGARHLVMTSSEVGCCWFQEAPGPGPGLADFGEFSLVIHFTSCEARA
jgi:hypothetical protein